MATPNSLATTLGSGLGARTQICSVAKGTGDHTQANLDALEKALGLTHTLAGIAGTIGTDPLYVAVQGTADVEDSAGDYVADITLTVVADFKD